jgi:transposase InsO family protein
MDNANRSPQLARIAASLGIFIIHTPPYQPEGCGKIERFFRSVREQSGQTPDARGQQNPDRGLAPGPWWHWLDTVYHCREHSSLQTTPLLRWQRDIQQVRQLPPATDMRRLFFHRVLAQFEPGWCAATPPFCCATASLKRLRNWPASESMVDRGVRFDPLDLAHVEIYCDGKPEARRA